MTIGFGKNVMRKLIRFILWSNKSFILTFNLPLPTLTLPFLTYRNLKRFVHAQTLL